MIFYSQLGEDLFIFRNFINQKRDDRIFVELGACDGVIYSNTKFFEDNLNFKGILIEPLPNIFNNLQANRRNSKCYNLAISNKHHTVNFIVNNSQPACSGITELMADTFMKSIHKNSNEIKVNACPLRCILDSVDTKYIDILSIDVEGGENLVLDTMNWDIEVYIICIELDGLNSEKDEYCRSILKNKGFEFELRIHINEFWINKNYSRKYLLYKEIENKELFTNICDYGIHKYTEPHCIPEINKILKEYELRKNYKINLTVPIQ